MITIPEAPLCPYHRVRMNLLPNVRIPGVGRMGTYRRGQALQWNAFFRWRCPVVWQGRACPRVEQVLKPVEDTGPLKFGTRKWMLKHYGKES